MKIRTCYLILAIVTMGSSFAQVPDVWYNDQKMDYFIDSLIGEMTLREKIGQTVFFSGGWVVAGPKEENLRMKDARNGNIGAAFYVPMAQIPFLQKEVVENSRLGIPLLFAYDVIHGYKITMPIPLGQAASWDIGLIERGARIAACEASAAGINWTFGPMVDIARDPRWGRIAEGSGEDPYLGSRIAEAMVHGFQGEDLSAANTILSCAKHYAAYGAAEAGRDYNTIDISERVLREIYLPPFKAACEAGAATYMTSFNDYNGIPCTSNSFLLTDVLKGEWGFKGFVATDHSSIREMIAHGTAKDEKEAGENAMNAGVDMDTQTGIYLKYMEQSVGEGKVPVERINDACRRILRMKYILGLFEDPYRYCNVEKADKELLKPENFTVARELAKRSMVLLKNEGQLLPLRKNTRSIALIGPMADNKAEQLGTYHGAGSPENVTSILEALKEKVSGRTEIIHVKGSGWDDDDRTGFQKAVEAAKKADMTVLCMGEPQSRSGEAASIVNIEIPPVQKELIREIQKTGKPIVLLVHSGRPLVLTWEDENIPAILECWQLGSQAGPAIADVLFGDYNPSGKLPVTFPRHAGQIPIYYNHKNTGRPFIKGQKYTTQYLDVSNDPLYPFGYGLSYTNFEYSEITLSNNEMGLNDTLTASVTVTNTGKIDGEEIVQLYLHDIVGSVTRPVKELKGFEKVLIHAGESVTVNFKITSNSLAFYRSDMTYGVEEGDFGLFIGKSSSEVKESRFRLKHTARLEF